MGQTHQQQNEQPKSVTFDDKLVQQIEQCHNLMAIADSKNNTTEYNTNLAQIIGQVMVDINGAITRRGLEVVESFAQQYILEKGLKKVGGKGEHAIYKEAEQLH